MLSPLPRQSGWAHHSLTQPSHISFPRKGYRVGLRIDLFEACSAFTRVTACTLALSPYIVTRLTEGFSHFVTSIAAPAASGWSGCRVGFTPTGERRLGTAHTQSGHFPRACRSNALSTASVMAVTPVCKVGFGNGANSGEWLAASGVPLLLAAAHFSSS